MIADGRCDVDVAQTHDRRLPPPDGRSRRSREVPQRSVLESEAACLGRFWLPEYEADVLANQCLEGAMRLPRSHAVPSPACTGSSRNRVCPLAKSVEMTPATPAVVAQKGSEGEKRAPERRSNRECGKAETAQILGETAPNQCDVCRKTGVWSWGKSARYKSNKIIPFHSCPATMGRSTACQHSSYPSGKSTSIPGTIASKIMGTCRAPFAPLFSLGIPCLPKNCPIIARVA